jgi:hypothetical protein
LRISEALALAESDLDSGRSAILVRHGKGGKRREVGMDRWAWEQLDPWLKLRSTLPVGALFCVLRGPTRGRPWSPAGVRAQLHVAAARAGVRRRFAPQAFLSCQSRWPDRRRSVTRYEPPVTETLPDRSPSKRRKRSRPRPAHAPA